MREKIKQYWEERAKQCSGSLTATTDDVYLRELEILTIIKTLNELSIPKNRYLLDVGCGDGYSTIRMAQENLAFFFLGVDYTENMIKNACKRLECHPELKDRITFIIGDVMDLGGACGESVYDVVLADRCLINLDSFESQSHAIANIAEHTKKGGYYIAIENFVEGHENMNSARRAVGLPEIPVRWHNLYFKENEFAETVKRFFELLMFKDFSSSYYFATRVIYSAMCQMRGTKPDYNHEIHQLAVHLPWIGQFSPVRMAIMRRNLN